MPEELCQVSPKSHYGVLASHSDPSPCNPGIFWYVVHDSYMSTCKWNGEFRSCCFQICSGRLRFRNLLKVIQSVILKGEFEGGSRKLASGTSGREMGWQRIKSENSGGRTSKKKEKKQAHKLDQNSTIILELRGLYCIIWLGIRTKVQQSRTGTVGGSVDYDIAHYILILIYWTSIPFPSPLKSFRWRAFVAYDNHKI